MKQFSPVEVLKNSIEQPSNIQYYGESTTYIEIPGIDESEIFVKEWRNNELQRSEIDDGEMISTSITNGEETLVFDEGDKKAYLFSSGNHAYGLSEPKEEMDTMLSELYESHRIELMGDETIAKRKTFHLLATPLDEKNSDLTTYDIWIDKQYWVILKMQTVNDQMKWLLKYDHIEFNPKFQEDIFAMDPPEGYTLGSIDDEINAVPISVEEAKDFLGEGFLYFPPNELFKLEKITYQSYDEADEEIGLANISFLYTKNKVPFMELIIIANTEEPEEIPFTDKDTIHIRGKDVSFVEDASFLSWREDGYLYMIDFFDLSITKEQIEQWTNNMIHPE